MRVALFLKNCEAIFGLGGELIEEKEETKKCTVRMKASQKETIKKLATKRNMSESALINEFIEKGMKEKDIIDYYRWGDLY